MVVPVNVVVVVVGGAVGFAFGSRLEQYDSFT